MSIKDNIIKLRNEGKNYNDISKILNCSKSTISYYCKNIENNDNLSYLNTQKKNINQTKSYIKINFGIDVDEVDIKNVIFYRKSGYTYKKISNNVNISIDKIKKICRVINLNKSLSIKKYSEDDIKEMQKYYDEINSIRKVSEKFGISRDTISKYLKINKRKKITLEEYKIKRKQDQVINVINWRKNKKQKLVDYKGGCCQKCNYNKSIGALEFHHLDPNEKDFGISAKSYSYERLKKEVDKCILVCSNCHIEIHEEIKNNGYSEIVNNIKK